MTISKKIVGGYGIALVMLIIVIICAFYSFKTIQNGYNEYIDVRVNQIFGADELGLTLNKETSHVRGWFLSPDTQSLLDDLREDYRQFEAIVGSMQKRALTDVGLGMVRELADLHEKYKDGQEKVIAIAQEGRIEGALALGIKETRPVGDELTKKVEQFRARQVRLASERRAEVTTTANLLFTIMMVISALAVISSIAVAFHITRTLTRQLRESIARISSSSAEILIATTQVSSGSQEMATAVEETTTTVEEVKQTSELSIQKANNVVSTAGKAEQVSLEGRKATEDGIEEMRRIKGQMDSIAESIVSLSEQSQAVGEIIATVDDISDQSNLLAVNASIESAKAGEHGRGFGVVAQEIRGLAEQSKQSTTAVRNILNDIQRAISQAVMVTEQGSKAVESGMKQSTRTGEAIAALASSIVEAADAATQIAVSSKEQLIGMDQVALAMEDIRQASSQNAIGSKQTETAMRNLQKLGENLKRLIERH